MKNVCKIITKTGKICKKYKKKNCDSCSTHKPKEKCSICFENILKEKTLHCLHKYCSECISKWIYIEQKDTCPLCRNLINDIFKYDAFKYCLDNKFITTVCYNYYLIDTGLISEYLDNIIMFNSDYDHVEWNTIINHLKKEPEIYLLFLQSHRVNFIYYQLFDEHNQGINNVIYNYNIILV